MPSPLRYSRIEEATLLSSCPIFTKRDLSSIRCPSSLGPRFDPGLPDSTFLHLRITGAVERARVAGIGARGGWGRESSSEVDGRVHAAPAFLVGHGPPPCAHPVFFRAPRKRLTCDYSGVVKRRDANPAQEAASAAFLFSSSCSSRPEKKIEKNPLSRLSLVLLLENAKKKLANFDAERTAFRPDLRKAEKRRDTSRVTGRAEGVGREAAVELDPRRRRRVEPAGEIGGRLGEHADVVGEEEARDPAGDAGDVDSGELGCV